MEASNVIPIIMWACGFLWSLSIFLFIVAVVKMTFEKQNYNFNLTEDDIDFLLDLQKEMLTQDTVCQAAPRFWVVAGTRREYRGKEYSCDGEILIHDTEEVADGLKDAVEYFNENYYEEMESKNIKIIDGTLKNSYRVFKIDPTIDNTAEEYIDGEEVVFDSDCLTSISELLEAMIDVGVVENDGLYDTASYSNEHYVYPNTMFLTNRSCKKHIEINHYHYSADAHSYAMTAWRSPEVERLWNILDKIDWRKICEVSDVRNQER